MPKTLTKQNRAGQKPALSNARTTKPTAKPKASKPKAVKPEAAKPTKPKAGMPKAAKPNAVKSRATPSARAAAARPKKRALRSKPAAVAQASGAEGEADSWAALASLASWKSTPVKSRHKLAARLVGALGSEWHTSPAFVGKEKLLELVHEPTDLRFLVVPGGEFVAGMRDADLKFARTMRFDDEETRSTLEAGPQAKPSAAAPFLCGRTPLLERHARALRAKTRLVRGGDDAIVTFTRNQADAALMALPPSWRLLSAMEWEYVARSGGVTTFINGTGPSEARAACDDLNEEPFDPERQSPGSNALGIWGLPWGDWVAGKNKRYAGAACGGVAMEFPWPSDDAIVGCFAGLSIVIGADEASCVRVAVDLPQ